MKINSTVLAASILVGAIGLLASNTHAYDYGKKNSDSKNNGYGSAKSGTVVTKVKTDHGEVFANGNGLTLYTFTKDSRGKSNCYDGCAVNWPPFNASKDVKEWGAFTKVKRKDNSYQWAYEGQPLYTWIGDQNEGDTYGQGVGGVWYVLNTSKN